MKRALTAAVVMSMIATLGFSGCRRGDRPDAHRGTLTMTIVADSIEYAPSARERWATQDDLCDEVRLVSDEMLDDRATLYSESDRLIAEAEWFVAMSHSRSSCADAAPWRMGP